MSAKQVVTAVCALVVLGGGVATAGPCSTGQTTGKAAQEDQRQQHAQPGVAEQPRSAGTTGQSDNEAQGTVPSSKMTDANQSPATPPQGSLSSSKMDQGC
jgi:hypothetical protein